MPLQLYNTWEESQVIFLNFFKPRLDEPEPRGLIHARLTNQFWQVGRISYLPDLPFAPE
jgi:hypothetical protein